MFLEGDCFVCGFVGLVLDGLFCGIVRGWFCGIWGSRRIVCGWFCVIVDCVLSGLFGGVIVFCVSGVGSLCFGLDCVSDELLCVDGNKRLLRTIPTIITCFDILKQSRDRLKIFLKINIQHYRFSQSRDKWQRYPCPQI